jgi:hypothetical protein
MSLEFTPGRIGDLILETLPNGELAWLRADLDAAICDADQLDEDLTRTLGWRSRNYTLSSRPWLTQQGADLLARERAMHALFGRPWPSVAETCQS